MYSYYAEDMPLLSTRRTLVNKEYRVPDQQVIFRGCHVHSKRTVSGVSEGRILE